MLKVTSWLKCIHVYLCVIANNVILKHHCKCSHVFTKIINIIGKINSSMIQLIVHSPLKTAGLFSRKAFSASTLSLVGITYTTHHTSSVLNTNHNIMSNDSLEHNMLHQSSKPCSNQSVIINVQPLHNHLKSGTNVIPWMNIHANLHSIVDSMFGHGNCYWSLK